MPTTRKRTSISTHQVKGSSVQRHHTRLLDVLVDGNGVVFTVRALSASGGEMDIRIPLGEGADLAAFLRAALHGTV